MAEVTSSSLVGPTNLFRCLAKFLKLLVLHLCHFCASEEKIMASFIKRNGSWTARIRKTGFPETTQTFASKASALQWSQRVESDPEKFLTEQVSADHQLVTLGDLVRKYGNEVTPAKKGRDKEKYRLRILQRSLLSGVSLRNLKSHHLTTFRED